MAKKFITWFCELLFELGGWKFLTAVPPTLNQFILVGAPHTSNWDFVLAMAFLEKTSYKTKFFIKQEWTTGLLGRVMNRLGAIGIDRKKITTKGPSQTTDLMAQKLQALKESPHGQESYVLLIAPEGTRNKSAGFKKGFYHIAAKANIPIVLAKGDYETKRLILSGPLWPSGNIDHDFDLIRNFYRDAKGKHPSFFSV